MCQPACDHELLCLRISFRLESYIPSRPHCVSAPQSQLVTLWSVTVLETWQEDC